MISHSLAIRFETNQADPLDLVSRIRNFGEDAYRFLRATGWGMIDLEEVDSATSQFGIQEVRNSRLRRVESWVQDELKRQHLSAVIEVRWSF